MRKFFPILAVGLLCLTVCAKSDTSDAPTAAERTPATAEETAATEQQQPAGAVPSIEQVLDKFTNALGGRAAMNRLESVIFKGTLELPGETRASGGTAEMTVKAPNLVAFDAAFPSLNYSKRQVFDGTNGWEREQKPDGQPPVLRQITGLELDGLRRESDLYRYFKLPELYPQMKVIGRTAIDDRQAYEVDAMTPEGRKEKMYFDADTGFLLVVEAATVREGKTIPYRIYYDDYRAAGNSGVTLPFTYTIFSPTDDGDVTGLIIRFKEAQINRPLSAEVFAKPRS